MGTEKTETVVPLFFANSGRLRAATLKNPALAAALRLAKLVAAGSPWPSLDLFSDVDVSAGADVSVRFRPDRAGLEEARRASSAALSSTAAAAASGGGTGGVVLRTPILRYPIPGVADARDQALAVSPKFSLVTVDPPFSVPEQRKLYARVSGEEGEDVARALMLGGGEEDDDIAALYRESVTFAARCAAEAVLVLGYKAPEIEGWRILSVVAQGAGSGHPAVLAVLYVPDAPESLARARAALKEWRSAPENAALASRSWPVRVERRRPSPAATAATESEEKEREEEERGRRTLLRWMNGETAEDGEGGGDVPSLSSSPLVFTLPGRADLYKRWRLRQQEQEQQRRLPAHHPRFLSAAQLAISKGLLLRRRGTEKRKRTGRRRTSPASSNSATPVSTCARIRLATPSLYRRVRKTEDAFSEKDFDVRPVAIRVPPSSTWSDVSFEVVAEPKQSESVAIYS